jgi:hypothetical protein
LLSDCCSAIKWRYVPPAEHCVHVSHHQIWHKPNGLVDGRGVGTATQSAIRVLSKTRHHVWWDPGIAVLGTIALRRKTGLPVGSMSQFAERKLMAVLSVFRRPNKDCCRYIPRRQPAHTGALIIAQGDHFHKAARLLGLGSTQQSQVPDTGNSSPRISDGRSGRHFRSVQWRWFNRIEGESENGGNSDSDSSNIGSHEAYPTAEAIAGAE